jgi:hypothetical protein
MLFAIERLLCARLCCRPINCQTHAYTHTHRMHIFSQVRFRISGSHAGGGHHYY